jgi:Uma2 family endonuclease
VHDATTDEELPMWAVPPPDGYCAGDLDRLPHLPQHTELIDGSLVFTAPRPYFHSLATSLLQAGLHRSRPAGLTVCRGMTAILGPKNRTEPDLSVVRSAAISDDWSDTGFHARDLDLVVEVVSPESVERDRKRKPQLYAEAGIPHFWRVEEAEGMRPVVYVYELDPATAAYSLTGIFREQLKLSVPFTVDIDLAEIDRL